MDVTVAAQAVAYDILVATAQGACTTAQAQHRIQRNYVSAMHGSYHSNSVNRKNAEISKSADDVSLCF